MRAILQRVHSASVTVDRQLVSQIGRGILVFAAVGRDDTPKEAQSLAAKVVKLKLWDDDAGGRWKKNVAEIDGEVLCVSQFTLYANTKKGNKPDFHNSAGPDKGRELYDLFLASVREHLDSAKVKDGVFQAMMDVALVNDGPVTMEINVDPPKEVAEPSTKPTPRRVEPSENANRGDAS